MGTNLKPCPFCGSAEGNLAISEHPMSGRRIHKEVHCSYCDASKSLDEWNNRPREQELEAENQMLKERILNANKYLGDVYESDYTGNKRKYAKDELSKAIYMFNRNETKRKEMNKLNS